MVFSLILFISLHLSAQSSIQFDNDFLFGIANAPGHVEDQLNDIWIDFGKKGRIKAYANQTLPEERLRFWSRPDIEINLAHELGVQVFRLGVDWGRVHVAPGKFDREAVERYREILREIKSKKMKVMLTLFHFTVPKWIQDSGGWVHEDTKNHFVDFSKFVLSELGDEIDYIITFNEPQIFSTMAYGTGIFPPGDEGSIFKVIASLKEMISAHKTIYTWGHTKFPQSKIGIAQHMGHHMGKSFLNDMISKFTGHFMNWYFPDRIAGYMDYFGFNYYGAEWIDGASISIDPDEEYSEAGRAIYPQGLYKLSKDIDERFITENGVADSTDWIRPSYLIEHLKVVSQLQREKIKILGYIHWTLTDNMEWSDGYCPKFGLVSVDRANDLKRMKRPSFSLYQSIIKERMVSIQQQNEAWNLLQLNVGKARPFCRDEDGKTGLDHPIDRAVSSRDWRFIPTQQ